MTDCHSVLCWSVVNAVDSVNRQWLSSAYFSLGMSQRLNFSLYSDIARCLPPIDSHRSCTGLQRTVPSYQKPVLSVQGSINTLWAWYWISVYSEMEGITNSHSHTMHTAVMHACSSQGSALHVDWYYASLITVHLHAFTLQVVSLRVRFINLLIRSIVKSRTQWDRIRYSILTASD